MAEFRIFIIITESEQAVEELYQDYGTQSEERFEGYDIRRRRRRSLSTSPLSHQIAPQELVLSTQISLVVYLRSVVCIPPPCKNVFL